MILLEQYVNILHFFTCHKANFLQQFNERNSTNCMSRELGDANFQVGHKNKNHHPYRSLFCYTNEVHWEQYSVSVQGYWSKTSEGRKMERGEGGERGSESRGKFQCNELFRRWNKQVAPELSREDISVWDHNKENQQCFYSAYDVLHICTVWV